MSRKKWSPATKFEIALLALKGETTLNEICARYQVAPSQVHAWKKQLLEQGAELFAKNTKSVETVYFGRNRTPNSAPTEH